MSTKKKRRQTILVGAFLYKPAWDNVIVWSKVHAPDGDIPDVDTNNIYIKGRPGCVKINSLLVLERTNEIVPSTQSSTTFYYHKIITKEDTSSRSSS